MRVAFRIGDPASEIQEFLRGSSSDMIVLATHGRSGAPREIFGSVADQIVQSSPVPVVLLHPNHHEVAHLRTVLVPLDGTPGAAVALATAVALVRGASTNWYSFAYRCRCLCGSATRRWGSNTTPHRSDVG